MADEPGGLHGISIGRVFPWARLFRALGVSIDAKKLILAALGLLVFHLGRGGSDHLLHSSAGRRVTIAPPRLGPPGPTFPSDRAGILDDLPTAPWRLTEPARYLV